MRASKSTLALAAAAAAFSSLAYASGWDWDMEFQGRHWRGDSLQWAQDIYPTKRSLMYFSNNYDPPAHEMWCHHPGEQVTQYDCDMHYDLLAEWVEDFLDVSEAPAWAMDSYPNECASICY